MCKSLVVFKSFQKFVSSFLPSSDSQQNWLGYVGGGLYDYLMSMMIFIFIMK